MAIINKEEGSIEKQEEKLQEILIINPAHVETYITLGNLQMLDNRSRIARKSFEKILQAIDSRDAVQFFMIFSFHYAV